MAQYGYGQFMPRRGGGHASRIADVAAGTLARFFEDRQRRAGEAELQAIYSRCGGDWQCVSDGLVAVGRIRDAQQAAQNALRQRDQQLTEDRLRLEQERLTSGRRRGGSGGGDTVSDDVIALVQGDPDTAGRFLEDKQINAFRIEALRRYNAGDPELMMIFPEPSQSRAAIARRAEVVSDPDAEPEHIDVAMDWWERYRMGVSANTRALWDPVFGREPNEGEPPDPAAVRQQTGAGAGTPAAGAGSPAAGAGAGPLTPAQAIGVVRQAAAAPAGTPPPAGTAPAGASAAPAPTAAAPPAAAPGMPPSTFAPVAGAPLFNPAHWLGGAAAPPAPAVRQSTAGPQPQTTGALMNLIHGMRGGPPPTPGPPAATFAPIAQAPLFNPAHWLGGAPGPQAAQGMTPLLAAAHGAGGTPTLPGAGGMNVAPGAAPPPLAGVPTQRMAPLQPSPAGGVPPLGTPGTIPPLAAAAGVQAPGPGANAAQSPPPAARRTGAAATPPNIAAGNTPDQQFPTTASPTAARRLAALTGGTYGPGSAGSTAGPPEPGLVSAADLILMQRPEPTTEGVTTQTYFGNYEDEMGTPRIPAGGPPVAGVGARTEAARAQETAPHAIAPAEPFDVAEFIRDKEDLRLSAYADSKGNMTIGWGHLMKAGEPDRIDADQAETLFDADLARAVRDADDYLQGAPPLSPVRYAAVVSMAFQMGRGGLFGFRNARAAMRRGDWDTAAREMLDSAWAKRDTPARAQEAAAMMLTGQPPGFSLRAAGRAIVRPLRSLAGE